jgi:hypothetical protein
MLSYKDIVDTGVDVDLHYDDGLQTWSLGFMNK